MNVLLWDFDGTLAAREGMWAGTLAEVANRVAFGQQVTVDEIRPFLQSGFPWQTPDQLHPNQSPDEWWAAMHPLFVNAYVNIGLDPKLAESLAVQVRETFLDETRWRVFDDVWPCLSSLQQLGWAHYILSNHVPELSQLVDALGLSSFFSEVSTSALTGFEKPHPEAFKGLLRRLPDNSTVWMIGDNFVADVQGANKMGVPAILVRRKQESAQYYCESLRGVEEIVRAYTSPLT